MTGLIVNPDKVTSPPRGPTMSHLERAAWRVLLHLHSEEDANAAEFQRDERWQQAWLIACDAQVVSAKTIEALH